MIWMVCLAIAVICVTGSVIYACINARAKYKSGSILNPYRILFVGVIASSLFLFFPIYNDIFQRTDYGAIEKVAALFETALHSIFNTVKLFLADGEFESIATGITAQHQWVQWMYSIMFSGFFVAAPFLTFKFVLSFFKNVSAYERYVKGYNCDAYIFSEINEKSLALAESLSGDGSKKRLLVFTDVFEREEEESYELVERARELGAVCFKKDIITVKFSLHSRKKELNFFAMGEKQSENINQALKIIEKHKHRENTNLYVFSTLPESELLLVNAFESNDGEDKLAIKVRRVNEVQSLINRNLYENGFEKIFSSARSDADGTRRINAVVVGMGQHGTEMTKALTWFCQMDGYEVEINSFDVDEKAEEKFISRCPELMAYSGRADVDGEARYTVNVYSDVDVDTVTFDKLILGLPETTYVFIALGNDEKNISAAIKLRAMFERLKHKPVIQTVVYNSEKKEALCGIKNFKGMPYGIDFIGDMKSSYSEKVILDSDVEEEALKRHLKWGEESEFWRYDYNYKSSVASAIHRKMKILCGMPGAEKIPEQRSESELWALRILEHRRWNAYMRAEGYIYGGTVEKEGRNDLAKTHNCLVPFHALPLKEQEKDDD